MRVKEFELNILGNTWRVVGRNEKEDTRLENCSGLTDVSSRTIVLSDVDPDEYTISNPQSDLQRTLRHEIIHAFMYESGLWVNSTQAENWAMNEEMVDWFAIQLPKIDEACTRAGAMPGMCVALE